MDIVKIQGRMVLDSRGNPTVEADVVLEDGSFGRAAVPSGASTGTNEAVELRDGDPATYRGKGVKQAVAHINEELARALAGKDASDQKAVDKLLIETDGTPNKSNFGANAILAVSLASVKAAAVSAKKPLYVWLHELYGGPGYVLPTPLINIINGGKHAAGSTDIQEFMVAPIGAPSFSEAVRYGVEVFHSLAGVLKKHGYDTTVGDEGGFAPHVKKGNEEALKLISEAIEQAGYELGKDIVFALDVAASELRRDGSYCLDTEKKTLSSDEMVGWLENLAKNYPIQSIEDGLAEDDWTGWQVLTKNIGSHVQLVGDDLFVTNTEFLKRGISEKAGNAILIKPNQIGTVSETAAAITMARDANWNTAVSHRSGETEDTSIAHVAVGLATGQIKAGSMSRTDRTAKYNELLRIEELLGPAARYAGSLGKA